MGGSGGGGVVGGSVGLIRCQKEDQESRGANSLSVTRALFFHYLPLRKKNVPLAFRFKALLCFDKEVGGLKLLFCFVF